MAEIDPTGTDWSDGEIDVVVADYFEMLQMERTGTPYVKAERNRELQELTRRSRGSIEFKHQNISAVLLELGLDWISGYKPMANYQNALINAVERYLDKKNEILIAHQPALTGAAEEAALFLEPPPILGVHSVASKELSRLVRKFDPAARDARNRALGKRGEERVFLSEISRLKSQGRLDLAGKVRWISEEDGDGAGYDVLSFDTKGEERLLEVKTTVGSYRTPFFLSENERRLSTERPDAFRLLRLYDFNRTPKAFELVPPIDRAVNLTAANYKASFDR